MVKATSVHGRKVVNMSNASTSMDTSVVRKQINTNVIGLLIEVLLCWLRGSGIGNVEVDADV